jgi:hypothetical protein
MYYYYYYQKVNNMDHGEMGFKDGRWMVLANDPVKWWALV